MSKANRNLHILIIPSWYPRFDGDISGSFFREQALALQSEGHQVGVIYPQFYSLKRIHKLPISTYGVEYKDDKGLATLKWHALNFTPGLGSLTKKQWINKGLKLFEEYKRKFGLPDIIHVHSMLNGAFLAYLLNSKFKIPYFITEHSSQFALGNINSAVYNQLKPAIKNADKCYAVSSSLSELLNKKFQTNKWNYLPNIVANEFLEAPLKSSNEFKFITVCFLTKNKNIDLVVRSFSSFLEKTKPMSNIQLIIGGDGPEKNSLQQLVKDLGIEKNVQFLGLLSREQVRDQMNEASCLLVASEYETFGVVAVEALALGKPVIATKCGGPESIINASVGFLVEKNSINEMTKAMIDIYKNKNRFHPQSIREYCIGLFSESAVATQLTIDYQKALTMSQS